jgi:hypothetical protein
MAAVAGQDTAPTTPPTPPPEGEAGIASKYPNDVGIGKDPAVIFDDDFESGLKKWENSWGGAAEVKQAEHVHRGTGAMELSMKPPAPGKETSLGVQNHFKTGFDVIFVRWYSKFEKDMDMLGHNHNNCCIAARAPGVPDAKPGIPADGKNEYTVAMETWRAEEKVKAPGEWNIYCYHPEQRSQWGDHFFPSGLILPQPTPKSPKNLFGKDFVARPNVVPERDKWICYELMVKANTPGQLDGRIAFWVDGKLAADFPNLRLRDVETLKANRIGFGMSTLNSKATNVNTMWFDDVVAATSYIGPITAERKAPPPVVAKLVPPPEKPSAAPAVSAQALAVWEAKLAARVTQGIKDGQRPTAHLKVMGAKEEPVKIVGSDGKTLKLEVAGNTLPLPWAQLTTSDRLNLARAFLKEDSLADLLLVAVFALADGRVELSEESFAKAQAADAKAGASSVAEARNSLGLK